MTRKCVGIGKKFDERNGRENFGWAREFDERNGRENFGWDSYLTLWRPPNPPLPPQPRRMGGACDHATCLRHALIPPLAYIMRPHATYVMRCDMTDQPQMRGAVFAPE